MLKISVLDIDHQYQGSMECARYCGSNLLHKLLDPDLPTNHMMTYNYIPLNMVCGGRTNNDFSQKKTKHVTVKPTNYTKQWKTQNMAHKLCVYNLRNYIA